MSTHSMVRRSSMRKSMTSTPNALEIEITPRRTPNRRYTKQTPQSISCVVKSDSSAQKLVFVLGDFLSKPPRHRNSTQESYFPQVYSDDSDISCSSTDSTNIETLKRKAEELNNTLAILEAKKKLKKQSIKIREENEAHNIFPPTKINDYSTNQVDLPVPRKRGRPKKNPTLIRNTNAAVKGKRGRRRKILSPLLRTHQIVECSNKSLSEESLNEFDAIRNGISIDNPLENQLSSQSSDEDGFNRYRSKAEACLLNTKVISNLDNEQREVVDLSQSSKNAHNDSSLRESGNGEDNVRADNYSQSSRIPESGDNAHGSQDLFITSQDSANTSRPRDGFATGDRYHDNEEPIPPCVWESQANFDNHQQPDLLDNRVSLSEADVDAILTGIADNDGVDPTLIQELVGTPEKQRENLSQFNEPVRYEGERKITTTPKTKLKNINCEVKKDTILGHKKFRNKCNLNHVDGSTDSESENFVNAQRKRNRKKKNISKNTDNVIDSSDSKSDDELMRISATEDLNNDNVLSDTPSLPPNDLVLYQDNTRRRSCEKGGNRQLKHKNDEISRNNQSISKSIDFDNEELTRNPSINKPTKCLTIETGRNEGNDLNRSESFYVNPSQSCRKSSMENKSKSPQNTKNSSLSNDELQITRNNQALPISETPLSPSNFDAESSIITSEEKENMSDELTKNNGILCPPPANITSPLHIAKEPSVDGGYISNVSSQIDDQVSQNTNQLENSMNIVNSTLKNTEASSLQCTQLNSLEINSTSSEPRSSTIFFKKSKFIRSVETLPNHTDDTTKKTSEKEEESEIPQKITEQDSGNEFSSDEEFLPSLHTLKKLRKNKVEPLENCDKSSVRSKSPSSLSSSDFEDTFAVVNNKGSKFNENDSDDLSSSDEEIRQIAPPKVVQHVDLASNFNSDEGDVDIENIEQPSKKSKKPKVTNEDISDDDVGSVQVLSCEQRLRTNNYSSDSSTGDSSISSNYKHHVSVKNSPSKVTSDNASNIPCKQRKVIESTKKSLTMVSSSDDSSSCDDEFTKIQGEREKNHKNKIATKPTFSPHKNQLDDNDDITFTQLNNHADDSSNDSSTKAIPSLKQNHPKGSSDSSSYSSDEEIVVIKPTTMIQNHRVDDSSDLSSSDDDNEITTMQQPPTVKSYDISSDLEPSIKTQVHVSNNSGEIYKSPQTKIKPLYYLSPDDSLSSEDDFQCSSVKITNLPDDFKNETDDDKNQINVPPISYNYINNTKEEDSIDIYTDTKELDESAMWVSLTQDNTSAHSDWLQRRLDIEENSLVQNNHFDELNNSIKKKNKKYKEKKNNEIEAVEEEDVNLNGTPKSKGRKSAKGAKKNDDDASEVRTSPIKKRKSLKNSIINKNEEDNVILTETEDTIENGKNDSMSKKKRKKDKMNKNDSLSKQSVDEDDKEEIEEHNKSISKKKKKNDSIVSENEIQEDGHSGSLSKKKKQKNKNNLSTNSSFGVTDVIINREDENINEDEINNSVSKKKSKKDKKINKSNNSFEEIDAEELELLDDSVTKKKKQKNKNNLSTNSSFGVTDAIINREDEINNSISKKKSKKDKKINKSNNSFEEIDAEELELLDDSVSKKSIKKKDKRTSNEQKDDGSRKKSLDYIPVKKALKRKRDEQSINDDSISDGPIKKKKKKALNVSLQEEHAPVSISHLPTHFLQDLASVKPHSSVRKIKKMKEKNKKRFKFVEKKHLNGSDFIPIETSTSTRFGVVPLNASNYGSQTAKGDFKQNMLFGNNIRRTNSQQSKAIKMKRKVNME